VRPSLLSPTVFKLEDAPAAYQQLHEGHHAVGILFEYPADAPVERKVILPTIERNSKAQQGTIGIGVIGAGNFTTGTLIPALKRLSHVRLRAICSAGGLSAKSAARRHGFEYCASDFEQVLTDPDIHAVVISTHHDTHARFAAQAMRAGKDVFVEKPLALTREQLDEVIAAQSETRRLLMVGYNRRFSPLSIAVRNFFAGRTSPIEMVCRVNAGALKADSWYQDPEEGGWRIISEGCHFVDLISFLCGSRPIRVFAEIIGGDVAGAQNDNCIVSLKMEDGSIGTLIYVANGDPFFEKERIEVFGQGRAAVIENWHIARLSSKGKTRKVRPGGTGKGHGNEIGAFIGAVGDPRQGASWFDDAVATTLATVAITESIRERQALMVQTGEVGKRGALSLE
jgi:polar amino acid transport system substrate-binding protein